MQLRNTRLWVESIITYYYSHRHEVQFFYVFLKGGWEIPRVRNSCLAISEGARVGEEACGGVEEWVTAGDITTWVSRLFTDWMRLGNLTSAGKDKCGALRVISASEGLEWSRWFFTERAVWLAGMVLVGKKSWGTVWLLDVDWDGWSAWLWSRGLAENRRDTFPTDDSLTCFYHTNVISVMGSGEDVNAIAYVFGQFFLRHVGCGR